MSKRLRLLALVLAVSVALSGCGGNKKDCAHDYYASDYSAPTASENGYNEYTCKKCGDSYKEVIPCFHPTEPITRRTMRKATAVIKKMTEP